MKHYIDKDALVAEFNRLIAELIEEGEGTMFEQGRISAFEDAKLFLGTLEVKEVDLEKEYKDFVEKDPVYNQLVNGIVGKAIAKHFFELGMQVSNPVTAADRGMAEEIIINLKRIEQDYHIDLTKEMEWLRNKTQKGEEV